MFDGLQSFWKNTHKLTLNCDEDEMFVNQDRNREEHIFMFFIKYWSNSVF